jgi:hypothetical protein
MTRTLLFSPIALALFASCATDGAAAPAWGDELAKADRIAICHLTSSETNPVVELTVATSAWGAHEAHGDTRVPTWYADADGDGFGDAETSLDACTRPEGTVDNDLDCDDGDAAVNPKAEEVCNGVDDDCDGEADEDEVCRCVVTFDQGHSNVYSDVTKSWTKAHAAVKDLGDVATVGTDALSAKTLAETDVLIVAEARVDFSDDEIAALTDFVKSGGSFVALNDYSTTFNNPLIEGFGVTSTGEEHGFTTLKWSESGRLGSGVSKVDVAGSSALSVETKEATIEATIDGEPFAVTLEHGDGRVAIFADNEAFDDYYGLKDVTANDNLRLWTNTIDWACGRE